MGFFKYPFFSFPFFAVVNPPEPALLFKVDRELSLFRVAAEQTIFIVTREAAV